MSRKTVPVAIGVLLAATYLWQIGESVAAGEPPRWLHLGGLALALAFVALQLPRRED